MMVTIGGSDEYLRSERGGAGTSTVVSISDDGNYNVYDVHWNTSRVFSYEDDVQLGNHTTNIPIINLLTFVGAKTNAANAPASSVTLRTDWIFIRQWVNPEPQNGDWGAEESEFTLTIYFHLGISSVLLNGTSVANGSSTDYGSGQVANITITVSSGFAYFRIYFDTFANHSHQNPRFQVINEAVTANVYALSVGGADSSGVTMLVMAVIAGFGLIILAVAMRRK